MPPQHRSTERWNVAAARLLRRYAGRRETERRIRRKPAGAKPIRREGQKEGRWVLLDYGEIVVHVQHEEERQFYALERLWRDCPVIDLPDASAS